MNRVPGPAEELVLDEDGGGEHDGALDRHGAEVLPHHVPAEGVLEPVLPWTRRTRETDRNDQNPTRRPGEASLARFPPALSDQLRGRGLFPGTQLWGVTLKQKNHHGRHPSITAASLG